MKVETLQKANNLARQINEAADHIKEVKEKANDPVYQNNEYFTELQVQCRQLNNQVWGSPVKLKPKFMAITPVEITSLYIARAEANLADLQKQLDDLQDKPEAETITE